MRASVVSVGALQMPVHDGGPSPQPATVIKSTSAVSRRTPSL
jgi:hypothetical protein